MIRRYCDYYGMLSYADFLLLDNEEEHDISLSELSLSTIRNTP